VSTMRLRMYGGTDIGLVRANNQDAYFCSAEHGIAIVSDGMGGHKGGEIASQMAVQGLKEAFFAQGTLQTEIVGEFLDSALNRINTEIITRANADDRYKGMGATINYLQFAGGSLAIGHAGDSRTYLIRSWSRPDGKLRYGMWCLTVDHNVGTFVERGLLIPGRDLGPLPLSERTKARLMRGMGVVPDLKADLYCKDIQEGDVYLTCSDGLHGFCLDSEILKCVADGPLAKTPERLIGLAHKAGAPDNVTVVLSVISEGTDPLFTPSGPKFQKSPFLVRLPSGQILGPMSSEELVNCWLSSQFDLEAEVCAALGPWVFLRERDLLFKTYPEFKTQKVTDHYLFLAPESKVGENLNPDLRQATVRDRSKDLHKRKDGQGLFRETKVTRKKPVALYSLLGVILGFVFLIAFYLYSTRYVLASITY
jgi:PPM family protein phosphatase